MGLQEPLAAGLTIKIRVETDWAYVEAGDPTPAYYALALKDPNCDRSPAYQIFLRNDAGRKLYGPTWAPPDDEPEWDGWHLFFDWENRRFPTGLLPELLSRQDAMGVRVEVADARVDPYPQFHDGRALRDVGPWDCWWPFNPHTPRQYQKEAVDKALTEGRGIIAAGTGAGKTMMAMSIIAALDMPTVFAVPNRDLLQQTLASFRKAGFPDAGISLGQIGDGVMEVGQVTVATHQTLHSRRTDAGVRRLLETVPVFVYDECHRAAADTVYSLLMGCKAFYRFGLSATPLLDDKHRNWRLRGAIGEVISRISPIRLVKDGFLDLPVVVRLPVLGEQAMRFHPKMPYQNVYKKSIVTNEARNFNIKSAVDWLMHWGRPTIVVAKLHGHLETFRKLFADAPYDVCVLSGKCSSEERGEALQRMRDGKLDVIVATNIFDEGVDVPNLGAVVLAAGEKSAIRLKQRIGRGMRKGGGSEGTMILIDMIDRQCRITENHTKKRHKVYLSEKYPVFDGWDALVNLPDTEKRALEILEGIEA